MRRLMTALSALALAGALAGCGSSEPDAAARTSGASGVTGAITVFAAASLTESFTTLGKQFERENPGTSITFSFAASSALAGQIQDGAPVDVFASAATSNMDQVVQSGDADTPVTFATNSMQIAIPPSNPGDVDSLDDLTRESVKTALCQPQVPCGATAARVFDNADITVKPVTLEPDVKSVLSKVTLGEVDAGVVYVTDVQAAGEAVIGVEIPSDVNASTSYPIATLTESSNPATAQAFVDFVLSPAGGSVLSAAGFGQP